MRYLFLFSTFLKCSIIGVYAQGWQWQHNLLTNSDENFNAIACDNQGNVFVGIQFNNLLQIGNYTFQTNPLEDVCVVKYDSLGNILWAQAFGGLYWDQINGMACDSAGNVFVVGHFISELFYNNTSIVGSTGRDIFIMRINADGTFGWIQTGANVWDEEASDVAVTPQGDVIVSGMANNTSVIAGMPLVSETPDVFMQEFIAKFSNSGEPLWIRSAGATDYSSNTYSQSCLAIGQDGSIHLGIPRTGGLNFAGQQTEGPGNFNTVILKWDGEGNPLWGWIGLSDGNDFLQDIALDDQGRVYSVISTVMSSTFAGLSYNVVPGDWGMVFIRLMPDGAEDRFWLATGARKSDVFALVCTSDNRMWFGGMQRYETSFPFGSVTAGTVDDRQGFICAFNTNTDQFEEFSRVHGEGWQYVYGACASNDGKIYFGGDISGSIGAPVYFGMQNELTDNMYIQGKTLPFLGRYSSLGCMQNQEVIWNELIEFCEGEFVELGPDVPIYSFQWSDGTTQEIQVFESGTYAIEAITTEGCIVRDSIVAETELSPQLNWVLQPVTCAGAFDGGISIEVLGSNPPYSLTWNDSSVENQFGGFGAGTYILEATSDAGCVSSVLIEITDPEPIEIEYSANFDDITGTGTLVLTQITGGTPPYTVFWPSHPQAEDSLSAIEPGTYLLQISDASGCFQDFNLLLSTGLVEYNLSSLRCYPQPTDDFLVAESGESFYWEVRDAAGRVLQHSVFADKHHRIDLRKYASGSYILIATSIDGGMRSFVLVKQ